MIKHFKVTLLIIFLAACGNGDASSEGSLVIRIVDDEFSPKVINVPVGSTVVWESGGSNNHNVIASDGSWQAISSDYFEYELLPKVINMSIHLMNQVFMNTTARIMEQITKAWLGQ